MTNVKISEEGRAVLKNQKLSRNLLKAITSHSAETAIKVVSGGKTVFIRTAGSVNPALKIKK